MSAHGALKFSSQNISDKEWIEYDIDSRFYSYRHQIQEIFWLNPKKILEIGIGNGFVSNYLRQRNFAVSTLDIDVGLKPQTVGSILNIPFSDNSFEVIACCEVLERSE